MPAILRDQIWQFVGAIFGFVAIIVTIILWRTQRRRKALSYEIISRIPLLSIKDEIKGKLEVFFDGKPVQDIHLIVFKIINSGNVPIVSTDYERPVSLTFGQNPQILSAEVSETDPDNLQVSVGIEATRVVLEPVLLNSGDSITLKLLVSGLDEISVDGRIVGIKDVQKFVARGPTFWPVLFGISIPLVGTGLFLGMACSSVLLVMDIMDTDYIELTWEGATVLIVSAVLSITAVAVIFTNVAKVLKKRLWGRQPTEH